MLARRLPLYTNLHTFGYKSIALFRKHTYILLPHLHLPNDKHAGINYLHVLYHTIH